MFVDTRLYRTPRYYLEEPKDYGMLIPQTLSNPVVFIGERTGEGNRLGGTAFFTSVPSPLDSARMFVYLVTAAHCVEGKTNLIARLNKGPDPGSGTLTADLPPGDDWVRYPEPLPEGQDHVDLAALLWRVPQEAAEWGYQWVPESMYFDEALLGDDPNTGVGISDEVVALGMLAVHQGGDRNAVVTRTGNISLIPDEPILVKYAGGDTKRMRLYLTELRSIGGLSGSPVFVRHRHKIGAPTKISLLGTMIGHWDDPQGNHLGFGKVVPADLLRQLLHRKELVDQRMAAAKKEHEGEPKAKADSSESEFDRFEELADKVVSVPKKEVDRKRAAERKKKG